MRSGYSLAWVNLSRWISSASTPSCWNTGSTASTIGGGPHWIIVLPAAFTDSSVCGARYTLTVTHLDGTEEKRTVDINVTGSCVTPTATSPPQDTTPPPAPSPAVPGNGLTLSCKSSQSLVWLPVDDPSHLADAIRQKLVLEIAGLPPRAQPAALNTRTPMDCLIGEKLRRQWQNP